MTSTGHSTNLLYTFLFFLFLSLPKVSALTSPPSCKSVPGDPSWPSPQTWTDLNTTLGGQLLQPNPPGAVCHPTHATYNATICAEVQLLWSSEFFHQRDPISAEWNNWNNDSCLPDERFPCSSVGSREQNQLRGVEIETFPEEAVTDDLGVRYPIFVVNATAAAYVKAGVDFARKYNIRLIVKSSGHDYVGRSSGPNSLSIWVHHMKGISFHSTSFTPQNCSFDIPGAAITAAGGTQMLETYQATDIFNHTVVGGNGRTVALGGYITGAGHSILSPHYGLATDQVLEMEVVTPMGEILVLNECQNMDLFWAMRGVLPFLFSLKPFRDRLGERANDEQGGGSTFAIMTSVTMKAYPSPQVLSLDFSILTAASNPNTIDMVAYLLGQYPSLAEAGVSGYPMIFKSVPNTLDGGKTLMSGVAGKVIMLNTTNSSSITSLFNPIFGHINSTWPGFNFTAGTKVYPSFNAWYQENYDSSPVGYENVMGSRLLDEKALSANVTATKLAFERFSEGGVATAYLIAGKGVREAVPRGGSNAVCPAWRRALIHATASAAFAPVNKTAETDAIAATNGFANALRELSPDMGAYMNEVSHCLSISKNIADKKKGAGRYEPNWQQAFWGDNYARLQKIKRSVDPDDVLWCAPCVGNERWEEIDNMLCRV
ncbi:related to isoamyl alcohol oxidase [Phialocephala subalpina]|uniref:Related to isoamyl alcohol oxidase n=1 Tax=Phialocephala subalpina TaxID=576137 RepID=A0A1L7WFQ6_9HELO|nr:related to isoamyl alcohol oxidase [Phialocephala subalpina]